MPALIPDRERFSTKLFVNAARQQMALDVEGIVGGSVDRQKPLGRSR